MRENTCKLRARRPHVRETAEVGGGNSPLNTLRVRAAIKLSL